MFVKHLLFPKLSAINFPIILHLIFTIMWWGRISQYSHFIGEKVKAQKGKCNLLNPHRCSVLGLGSNPSRLTLQMPLHWSMLAFPKLSPGSQTCHSMGFPVPFVKVSGVTWKKGTQLLFMTIFSQLWHFSLAKQIYSLNLDAGSVTVEMNFFPFVNLASAKDLLSIFRKIESPPLSFRLKSMCLTFFFFFF